MSFTESLPADGLVTFLSSFGPKETMDRLAAGVANRGVTTLARIDHAAAAAEVGLALRPTEVLIFGNPRAGTPLMEATQRIGIDLPLKGLVWQDEEGETRLATTIRNGSRDAMVPRPERNKSLKPWPTLWPPSRMRRRRERPGTRDDARLVGRRPEDDPRRRYTANLRGEVDTAALFKKPAHALEDAIDHGRYAAITARGFTEMQGELPVVVDGEVIDAIGESFATPEEDEEVAKQVLAALNRDRNLSIFSTPLR